MQANGLKMGIGGILLLKADRWHFNVSSFAEFKGKRKQEWLLNNQKPTTFALDQAGKGRGDFQ